MANTTHTTHATHATPTKLRSGEWGAKTATPVTEGEIITITTRAGKSWKASVEKVIWTNGQIAIVATGDVEDTTAFTSFIEPGYRPRRRPSRRPSARKAPHKAPTATGRHCHCDIGEDLMSLGYAHAAGSRVTCPGCGGWREVA